MGVTQAGLQTCLRFFIPHYIVVDGITNLQRNDNIIFAVFFSLHEVTSVLYFWQDKQVLYMRKIILAKKRKLVKPPHLRTAI